jgi:acetolactate synthase-1/2/3 large subunit
VKWAEAMGCVAFRVDTPDDVEPTIQKANEIDDRPVVIDFRTDYREKVYPMVAAGTSNSDVILDPAHDRPGGRD